MHISELQDRVKEDWENRSTSQPTREQQLLYIIEEFGEVAEAIRKQDGNKDRKNTTGDLGSEFADLLISITTLANTCDVDLAKEIQMFWQRLESRR